MYYFSQGLRPTRAARLIIQTWWKSILIDISFWIWGAAKNVWCWCAAICWNFRQLKLAVSRRLQDSICPRVGYLIVSSLISGMNIILSSILSLHSLKIRTSLIGRQLLQSESCFVYLHQTQGIQEPGLILLSSENFLFFLFLDVLVLTPAAFYVCLQDGQNLKEVIGVCSFLCKLALLCMADQRDMLLPLHREHISNVTATLALVSVEGGGLNSGCSSNVLYYSSLEIQQKQACDSLRHPGVESSLVSFSILGILILSRSEANIQRIPFSETAHNCLALFLCNSRF